MAEKARFIVDIQGEAEFLEPPESQPPAPSLKIGDKRFIFDADAVADTGSEGSYYVDQGGRVIDAESGDVITHGDGTPRISLSDIEDHKKHTT